MRAVVLVGGFGTRLRPLTADTPKQMLPVVDRPMIEHVVAHLAERGVDDAVLSLGYRPDAFLEAYPEGRCAGVSLHYAVEPEPLDTAGAIRFAALDAGIDDTFVVLNGDVLTDFDLGKLLSRHAEAGAEGTIHLTPVDDPSRYGVVPTDEDGRVEAFIEKPPRETAPSHWINAGPYVLEPSVIGRIPDGRRVSIERETFPAMVADRSLYAVESDDYWIDAGTPAAYLRAQLDLIDGHRAAGAVEGVSPTAFVDDATVRHSVLMDGVVIEQGAVVVDSVLLPGARVESGGEVTGSIVGPGALVEEGAVVTNLSVLGEGAVVEAGELL
ncbi:MAG TPA: NDP-sugar synthase, partial [Acidimicrobiales bacterium]|nr:NDP-sugar synthase [Acidimicrobiales bacterium]